MPSTTSAAVLEASKPEFRGCCGVRPMGPTIATVHSLRTTDELARSAHAAAARPAILVPASRPGQAWSRSDAVSERGGAMTGTASPTRLPDELVALVEDYRACEFVTVNRTGT